MHRSDAHLHGRGRGAHPHQGGATESEHDRQLAEALGVASVTETPRIRGMQCTYWAKQLDQHRTQSQHHNQCQRERG